MVTIEVLGISAFGYHGVYPDEQRDGQTFSVDVRLDVGYEPIADDIETAVNYGDVARCVAGHITGDPLDLIETLAMQIADDLVAWRLVQEVQVTVHKPEAPIPETFGDVSVTVARTRPPVILALGSNLGDRLDYLRRAVRSLEQVPYLRLTGVASVYETEPWGGVAQPEYLNTVVRVDYLDDLELLLTECLRIEAELGRERGEKWGPRVVDIDLIAAGEREIASETLTLPHPRAAERSFVLVPWRELDPVAALSGTRLTDLAPSQQSIPVAAHVQWQPGVSEYWK